MLFISITVLAAAEVENQYPSNGGRQCCSMSDAFQTTSISCREYSMLFISDITVLAAAEVEN
jgi:hypothetical protein